MTLQPLERFALDAAILFSDILTIPDAMGLGLYFVEGEGPKFERPLRDGGTIERLQVPDLSSLRYVFDAVALIRKSLAGQVPLIGFSGSPFTLACYMVEGGGSDDFRLVKSMLYSRPDLLHRILDVNAQAVTAYLNAQIAAGAQAVMVFDTWGGVARPTRPTRSSPSPTAARCSPAVTRETRGGIVPSILFTKGGGLWLEQIAGTAPTRSASTGPSTSARRARRVGRQGGPAGQPRPERAVRAGRDRAGEAHATSQFRRASADGGWRPRLQPRPRHHPAHAPGACGRPGRGRAPAFAPPARATARKHLTAAPAGLRRSSRPGSARPLNAATACR